MLPCSSRARQEPGHTLSLHNGELCRYTASIVSSLRCEK